MALFFNLITTILGSVGTLLNMTGYQVLMRNILFISLIVNILINYLLIPPYGLVGAAIATLVSTSLWRIIANIYVYEKFNFWAGYIPKIKFFKYKEVIK